MQYGFISDQYDKHEGHPWPDMPGVYSISVLQLGYDGSVFYGLGYEHLLYIGSSKNIRARLYNNHQWRERINQRFPYLDQAVIVRYKVTDNYLWEERSLIRTLRPILNIHHNG